MFPFLRSLPTKPVHDADDRPVGRILASEIDPTVGDPVSLLVAFGPPASPEDRVLHLGPDGEENEGEDATPARWLSFDRVRSIRRDAIHLDGPLDEILDDTDRRDGG